MHRTAIKFEKVATLITRGATEGERASARAAGRRMIGRYGLPAVLPAHPLNGIVGFSDEILAVLRAVWDFRKGTKRDEIEWFATFAAISSFGAKELGRALAMLRTTLNQGWRKGKGVWTGCGKELRFLSVIEWGLEQAFLSSAEVDGFTRSEASAFVDARTA